MRPKDQKPMFTEDMLVGYLQILKDNGAYNREAIINDAQNFAISGGYSRPPPWFVVKVCDHAYTKGILEKKDLPKRWIDKRLYKAKKRGFTQRDAVKHFAEGMKISEFNFVRAFDDLLSPETVLFYKALSIYQRGRNGGYNTVQDVLDDMQELNRNIFCEMTEDGLMETVRREIDPNVRDISWLVRYPSLTPDATRSEYLPDSPPESSTEPANVK